MLPLIWRRAAVLLLLVLALRYSHWRCTSSLNLADSLSATLSVLLLLAELWLLLHSFLQLGFSLVASPPPDAATATAQASAQGSTPGPPPQLPAVDVLVPSCGEPLPLLERCLRGCLAMEYPRFRVWLLDDSNRPELAALANRLGCAYLSRAQPQQAKAGNLNHALPWLQGDLLAVFDADVVPLRSFLSRCVPAFADPAVALLQTPQTYMNADPVIRNLGLERWLMPDEESFYRWVEPVRQAVDAVVCAGTSFVMRRAALLAVGGFETGSTSEDLATGIRLRAAGGRCLFLPEKLSAGLAPLTAAALVQQRCRWASGTLQTLRTGANPLTISGLRPLQRLAYLEGILHWLNAVPQLVLALMPLAPGLLGVVPIQASAAALLSVALPFYGAQLLLARWLSGQSRTGLMPELYRWLLLGPLLVVVLRTLRRQPLAFRVTPKQLQEAVTDGPSGLGAVGQLRGFLGRLRLLGLPLLLLLVQLLALGALPQQLTALPAPPLDGRAPLASWPLALAWGLINALLLLAACRICRDRPGLAPVPWFAPQRQQAALWVDGRCGLWVQVLRLSEQGVELRLPASGVSSARAAALAALAGEGGRVVLQLPRGYGNDPLVLPLQLQVQRRGWRRCQWGCLWGPLTPGQGHALQDWLYRRPGLWPLRRAPWEPLAILAALVRLLRPPAPETWFRRSALPITAVPWAPEPTGWRGWAGRRR